MGNTTLLIDEKEKENAKALTQSFARADIKSRAYVNALGAEACIKYLEEEGISASAVYNMHNIRKVLEEFDISDVMLSNIYIDVRVIYNENEIFVPKAHFDYNLIPDIYVVLKINKDYSETEFLGFFEPKMINKNNENNEYYFIEKEKLSSPSDLKNYIENFNGNTNSAISEADAENAENLMIAMSDHNINETDKKTLLNFLKTNAEIRNKFVEFENFEMLAYQTANTEEMQNLINNALIPETEQTQELSENTDEMTDIFDPSALEAQASGDVSLAMDEFLTNAEDSTDVADAMDEFGAFTEETDNNLENTLDEFAAEDIAEEKLESAIDDFSASAIEPQENDNNAIGNMLAGGAVLGAEIAGAAVASAAIAGAVEGAEIVKDTVEAAGAAVDMVGSAVDKLTENTPEIESKASDGLIDDIDVSSELSENTVETEDADTNIDDFTNMLNESDDNSNSIINEDVQPADLLEGLDDIASQTDNLLEETAESAITDVESIESIDSMQDMFGSGEEDITFEENNDIEFTNNDSFDDITFENSSDDITFENGPDDITFEKSSGSSTSSAPKGISTVVNTPISEATDLVSMESIQESMLAKKVENFEPGSLMETMEMDEFQSLVDNFVPQKIEDLSETTDFNTIKEESDTVADPKIPSDLDASLFKDADVSSSDDFVQEMPEEVEQKVLSPEDKLTSEDFVEEMPEEIEQPQANLSEPNSDNFVENMPEEINTASTEVSDKIDTEAAQDEFSNGAAAEEITDTSEDTTPALDDAEVSQDLDNMENFSTDMFEQADSNPVLEQDNENSALDEAEVPQELEDIKEVNTDMFEQTTNDLTLNQEVEDMTLDESEVPQELEDIEEVNTDMFEQNTNDLTLDQDVENITMDETETPQSLGDVEDTNTDNMLDKANIDNAVNQEVEDTIIEEPEIPQTPDNISNAETEDMFDSNDIGDISNQNAETASDETTHTDEAENDSEYTTSTDFGDDLFDQSDLEAATVYQPETKTTTEETVSHEIAGLPDIAELENNNAEDISENIEDEQSAQTENSIISAIDGFETELIENNNATTTEDNIIAEEQNNESNIDGDFSEIAGIEALDNFSEENLITEPDTTNTVEENSSLGVLYSEDNTPEQMASPMPEELAEDANTDFKPKKNYALIPIAGALIVTLIACSVIGVMMQSKNSVDSETLIQTSPENGTLASPETDNSGVLSNENTGIEPAIPENEDEFAEETPEANVVAPTDNDNKISQAAKQEAIKNTKEAVKNTNEAIKQQAAQINEPKKPLNANKSITLRKVSWEVPNYLSYSDNIKTYLQTAGKSIKLTLSSDLLLTNDYIYSDTVKIKLQLDKSGSIQSSQITHSSGSTQVDKIVLQTVKDTLNVVKPAPGEVPTPTYNLGIIIYL